jgi:hypothetical protein
MAGHEAAFAVLQVGQCSEAIELSFNDPLGVVEGFRTAGEADGFELRQHLSILSRLVPPLLFPHVGAT